MHQQLETVRDLALIQYLIFIAVLLFYINFCINFINMFTNTILSWKSLWQTAASMVSDVYRLSRVLFHWLTTVVEVLILALPYKSTASFAKTFSGLKSGLERLNLQSIYRVFQKVLYYLTYTGSFKKFHIIWYIQGFRKSFILFEIYRVFEKFHIIWDMQGISNFIFWDIQGI